MLAITRKQAIKKLLQEQKSVTISDLSERLNVTKETIRRDLRAMEKDQELIRTHGGAYILEGVQNDLDVTTRQALRITEKEIIDMIYKNCQNITCIFVAHRLQTIQKCDEVFVFDAGEITKVETPRSLMKEIEQ